MSTTPQLSPIDFEKIKQSVGTLTKETLSEKLAKFRTRQLTQQKKQAAKGGQALYNKKRNEEYKEMKRIALDTPSNHPHKFANLWEEINAKAEVEAESELEKFLDAQNAEPETEEQEA